MKPLGFCPHHQWKFAVHFHTRVSSCSFKMREGYCYVCVLEGERERGKVAGSGLLERARISRIALLYKSYLCSTCGLLCRIWKCMHQLNTSRGNWASENGECRMLMLPPDSAVVSVESLVEGVRSDLQSCLEQAQRISTKSNKVVFFYYLFYSILFYFVFFILVNHSKCLKFIRSS